MRLVLALLAALALVPSGAHARGLTRLYNATSTTAGSLDTGALSTGQCRSVVVLATAVGTNGGSSYSVQACRSSTASTCAGFGITLTAPTANATTGSGTLGPGASTSPAQAFPPPAYLRYQITAGASSTAQLTVYCEL